MRRHGRGNEEEISNFAEKSILLERGKDAAAPAGQYTAPRSLGEIYTLAWFSDSYSHSF